MVTQQCCQWSFGLDLDAKVSFSATPEPLMDRGSLWEWDRGEEPVTQGGVWTTGTLTQYRGPLQTEEPLDAGKGPDSPQEPPQGPALPTPSSPAQGGPSQTSGISSAKLLSAMACARARGSGTAVGAGLTPGLSSTRVRGSGAQHVWEYPSPAGIRGWVNLKGQWVSCRAPEAGVQLARWTLADREGQKQGWLGCAMA